MKKMFKYATVNNALTELAEKGYLTDFNLEEKRILKNPNGFEISYIYRYEGDSNPDDESTVYGIVSKETNEKGVYVAGNLAFVDNDTAKLLLSIEIRNKKNEG